MLSHLASLLVAYSMLLTGVDSSVLLHLKDGDRIVLVGGTLIRARSAAFMATGRLRLTLLHSRIKPPVSELGLEQGTPFMKSLRAGFGTTADGYRLLKRL